MATRTELSSERPRQILEAALKVFARDGLNARMSDVADEAGVSKGTLYLYFDSKDHLIESLMLAMFDEDLLSLQAIVAEDRPALDRLMDYAHLAATHFAIMQEQIAIAIEIFAMATRDEALQQALRSYYERYWELLTDLFRQGIARGEIRPDVDPVQVARRLTAMWDGEMMVILLYPGSTDIEQRFEHGARTLLDGIRERTTP